MADGDLVLWHGDAADLARWRASAAKGSTAQLCVVENTALQLDFTLSGHGAWVIARRELTATLPAHYAVVATVHGNGGPVQLQVKLVDPSGANVWWWRRSGTFTATPHRVVLHKAALEFAWGPASGGYPSDLAAVEIAVASDTDAAGSLRIDALRIEARDPASTRPKIVAVRASTAAPGHAAETVQNRSGTWSPAPTDEHPWLELDLGTTAEFGGVAVDFAGTPPTGRLLVSDDAIAWTDVADTATGDGQRRWFRTTDGDARYARIEFAAGAHPTVSRAEIVPLELAVSAADFVGTLARAAARGRYPRHLLGEQVYWAVVGADGDTRKGLLSEDGALEVDVESFTLEPFLWLDGRLLTWADAQTQCSLAEGHLPIPSVAWELAGLRLDITAFAGGEPERSALIVRYALTNNGGAARQVRLLVAVRPFQVTPAWQRLHLVGAVAPITALACSEAVIEVNHTRRVVAVTEPDRIGAVPSEDAHDALAEGGGHARQTVEDPIGFAEGVLAFERPLAAGQTAVIALTVPLHEATPASPAGQPAELASAWVDAELAAAQERWQLRLAIPIHLPPAAQRFSDTLRASLGWIMVNREGPRIQPGPRCYRRSWIRDGALTGTALAEMGMTEEPRAFLRWYAPYQLPDGRVPCAVDHNGVDHAVEHDSHGQLAWGVVETFRLTGDAEFLRELWPHVRRAVDALAALRGERTTDAYRGTPYFGLLPESISHEGYASHPVHSYWDDFFAVRGLADAAEAAALLDDGAAAAQIGELRDAMRADLHASIVRTIAELGIDFVPGSADLGDFDPTSTAIAFDPCAEAGRLPPDALRRTFEKYWEEFEARRSGKAPAEAYAPYEVRTAAALMLLGDPQRAVALLEWLMADQRPAPWCQWPEIAWRDRRAARFLGDLPHGWIASSFVRAVRRMLVYERPDDGVLVLAAGVPDAWLRDPAGVRVTGLPTHYGRLEYTLALADADLVRVTLGGDAQPPGGMVITSPLQQPLRAAVVDGRDHRVSNPRELTVAERAAEVLLMY